MPTFGERLKRERESKNVTLDEMSDATGIGKSYLEFLEADAIHELPGRAFGKLYIRAYAEVLEFDPQPWIEDYDREMRLDPAGKAEPPPTGPVQPRRVEAAIAQWREAKLKERAKPEPEVVDVPEPPAADEELPRWGASATDEARGVPTPVEPPRAAPPRPPAPPTNRAIILIIIFGMVAAAAMIYTWTSGGRVTSSKPATHAPAPFLRPAPTPRPTPSSLPSPAPTSAPSSTPIPTQTPAPTPAPTSPPTLTPTPRPTPSPSPTPRSDKPSLGGETPGSLAVTEYGVGRRVIDLKLDGEGNRFPQGARVWFATRVTGGRRGDVVRHVWIYKGRTQQTITMRVGGPDYRTNSNKTLLHSGAWAVEARDSQGRVLARSEFTCAADITAPLSR